jgi:uncharacterized protein involved in copper resistance
MLTRTRIALSALAVFATLLALSALAAPLPAASPVAAAAAPQAPADARKKSASTADHSKFRELDKDFKSGPEVTEACLICHTEAARQGAIQTDVVN